MIHTQILAYIPIESQRILEEKHLMLKDESLISTRKTNRTHSRVNFSFSMLIKYVFSLYAVILFQLLPSFIWNKIIFNGLLDVCFLSQHKETTKFHITPCLSYIKYVVRIEMTMGYFKIFWY